MACSRGASLCALFLALCSAAPAAAYRVDKKTQAVHIDSLRDFDACQKDLDGSGSDACLDALKAHVKARPKDAFEAGKRARLHYMHWVALDFFAQAFSERPSRKQCADEDVQAAVLSGLALPARYPAVALAQKLLADTCREELEPAVIARLDEAGGAFRNNACPLVRAQQVRGKGCDDPVREPSVAAAPPAPAEPKSTAEQLALAPSLRQAPPARKETMEAAPPQRLADVFPSIGALPPATVPVGNGGMKRVNLGAAQVDAESGEVLRGTHGEELTIARAELAGEQYVLLKFKGVRGPWNERVLVAIERVTDQGTDYVVAEDGREVVAMIERQRQYQAFPRGVKGGVWLNATRPNQSDVKLPNRRESASGLATAPAPK